jgi:hypothetical protein
MQSDENPEGQSRNDFTQQEYDYQQELQDLINQAGQRSLEQSQGFDSIFEQMGWDIATAINSLGRLFVAMRKVETFLISIEEQEQDGAPQDF